MWAYIWGAHIHGTGVLFQMEMSLWVPIWMGGVLNASEYSIKTHCGTPSITI